MAGRFYEGEQKTRPGVYYRDSNGDDVQLIGARNGETAVAFKANWGPLGKVVTLTDLNEIAKYFGDDSIAGSNVRILKRILQGGAATIKAVRVGSGGTKASLTLKGGSSDAVILTAAYAGNRALSCTIRDSLSIDTLRECIIYTGTQELLKVTFTKGTDEADALTAAINSVVDGVVVAEKKAAAATLTAINQTAFTAGTSPEVTAADYSAAFDLLEAEVFNTICVDTEDTAVHALLHAFILRAADAGLLALAFVGEPTSVDYATRKAHAKAFNSEHMHYVLNGFKVGTTTYEGADAAAYAAGFVAYLPCNDSITNKTINGATEVVGPLTNSQVIECLNSGAIVFTVSASGRVRIEQGINTLVTLADDQDAGWKKIRRTKTRFELITRVNQNCEAVPGGVSNDSNGQATVIAIANGVVKEMISEGKLISGVVTLDPANPPKGDSIWLLMDVHDLDSVEKIYIHHLFHFN